MEESQTHYDVDNVFDTEEGTSNVVDDIFDTEEGTSNVVDDIFDTEEGTSNVVDDIFDTEEGTSNFVDDIFDTEEGTSNFVDDIFDINEEVHFSMEEARSRTCPDDKTLLDLINRATPHPAVDFLKETRSLSQAALNTALILACQYGFKYLIHKLVQLGADIECRDVSGKTPLLICVENRYLDMVRFLVARGADVKSVDCAGNNALILSISFAGSAEITQFLLHQENTIINHQNQDGYTALMKALEVVDVGAVHLLLKGYLSQRFSRQSSHTYQNDNDWMLLDQTVNCKGETVQQIAEKYGLGNLFTLLKECFHNKAKPIRAAVGSRDLETVNFLLDSGIVEKYDMDVPLFKLFIEHRNNGNAFTKEEVTIIMRLVECGADLKSIPSNYRKHIPSLLFLAVRVGDYNLVEMFCKHGAPLNLSINGKESLPLSVAATRGRVDLMELMLKYNPEVNTDSFNNSPLDCALNHGHIDCARFLINHGAKLDIASALKSAVKSQFPEYMKFLFEHCESDTIKYLLEESKDENSLLLEAVRGGNQEIIEQILQAGVDINEPQSSGTTPIVECKNGAVAQFLISRGADVNRITNSTMRTPLMHVVNKSKQGYWRNSNDRLKEVVLVLLENGACVNARTSADRTPLMLAVEGQAEILQMLLDHGADCADRDKNGNTALIHATIAERSDISSFLIQLMKNNPDLLNVQNNRGLTALMYDLVHRGWDIASELIDNGADVNITDVNGNTALFHAISSSLPDSVLDILIRAGCNINHQNNAGLSPLMQAVRLRNYEDTVPFLLNLGADVNAVNHKDTSKTALTYLKENFYIDAIPCLEALLDRGANAAYLSPCFLFTIISMYPYSLIPKLIRCGLVPFDYSFNKMSIRLRDRVLTLTSGSSLCLTLLNGNATLARYFWDNLFLTNLDLSLASSNDLRQFLQERGCEECLSFLDEISSQPMSLFGLCFIAVSSAVGASPGREARVHQLPLPCLLKERLLFKSEVVTLAQPKGRDDNTGMDPLVDDFLLDSDSDTEEEYFGEDYSGEYYSDD